MNPWRVLLTGGTGFVGNAVCRHMADEGCEVHALYRRHRLPAHTTNGVHWHAHDGSDDGVRNAVQQVSPDAIVHLAAHVPLPATRAVEALVRGNVLFGTQVIAAAQESGCRYVLNTGTYWEHFQGTRATSLYAALKQAFGRVLDYYCDAHGMRAITLTLFDTYGPGDRRRKLVDLLIDASRREVPLAASDGHQRLALVHVDDVARAYSVALSLLPSLEPGTHRTFAVRSPEVSSLREIADLLARVTGRAVPVAWGAKPRQPRTFDTPPEIPSLPGWAPRIALADGLLQVAGSQARG